jgi:hypothetical protein
MQMSKGPLLSRKKRKPAKPRNTSAPKVLNDGTLRVRGIEVVNDKGETLISLNAFTEAQRLESVGGPVFASIAFHDPHESGDIVSALDNEGFWGPEKAEPAQPSDTTSQTSPKLNPQDFPALQALLAQLLADGNGLFNFLDALAIMLDGGSPSDCGGDYISKTAVLEAQRELATAFPQPESELGTVLWKLADATKDPLAKLRLYRTAFNHLCTGDNTEMLKAFMEPFETLLEALNYREELADVLASVEGRRK